MAPARERLLAWALVVSAALLGCTGGPPQTVVRFSADDALEVPAGAMVEVSFYAHGITQDQVATSTQTAPFGPDLQFVVDAEDGDASRRFTVFADLLDATGTRISWARVRTGFLSTAELAEVRVHFSPGCRPPPDRDRQLDDYAPQAACGSHDTCAREGEATVCAPACLAPEPFDADALSPEATPPMECEGQDCAAIARLTVGWHNTCATTADDVTFCWGRTHFPTRGTGLLDRPALLLDERGRASTEEAVAIDATANYLCALRGGRATCGGAQTDDQFGAPSSGYAALTTFPVAEDVPAPLTSVAVGVSLICVLDRDGALYCSGSRPDIRGELTTFTRIGEEDGFVALHGLRWGMCAGRSDRTLRCFGFDAASSFLGLETPAFRSVSSGVNSLCGVEDDGRVACFGWNEARENYPEAPTYLPGRYKSISVGRFFPTSGEEAHRCAVDDEGRLACWGQNTNGSAGLEADQLIASASPNAIGSERDWSDVVAGRDHTCASKENGELYCFGDNTFSQLGSRGPSTQAPRRVCVPSY